MPWGAVAGAAVGVIGNSLLNSGSQSQQSSQQQMPAWMQQQYQNVIGMGNAAAGRSASQAVAPLNGQQQQAFLNSQNAYGTGQPQLGQAANTAQGLASSGLSPQSMQKYMNPYTSQVVGTTLGQMQLQENQQNAALNSQATAANAFGGNRAAVAQALNNQNWTNAMGQTAASLNNQNFMNAGQLASQNAGIQLQGNQQFQNAIMGQQQLQMQQNQNLLSAGNQQQTQAQNMANWPIQAAQVAGAALNPGVGGTVTSSGQYGNYMSPVQSGMLGMNLGNQIGNYMQGQSFNNYMNNTVNPAVSNYASNQLDENFDPTYGMNLLSPTG